MRLSWLLRGSRWRRFHLLRCDTCRWQFQDGAAGAIDAASGTTDEAGQCLDFRGHARITRCPACAARMPLDEPSQRYAEPVSPIHRRQPMTALHPERPGMLPRPACTPAAIRAVLAANADAGVLARYDQELDAAFERARADGDLTPLLETVKRWWFEADAWRDPDAQRAFLARVEGYLRDGPPPADECMSREEIRAQYGL